MTGLPSLTTPASSPSDIAKVEITGGINETLATSVLAAIDTAEAKCVSSKQPWLPVYINTYGGVVYDGLAIVDRLQSCTVPIITIGQGKVMSMGVPLLSCGQKRFLAPNTSIMIHSVSTFMGGNIAELKVGVKQAKHLNDVIFDIMSKNFGIKRSKLNKILIKKKGGDLFLTAEQAREHNIATHIGLPRFSVKKSKTKFKVKFQ